MLWGKSSLTWPKNPRQKEVLAASGCFTGGAHEPHIIRPHCRRRYRFWLGGCGRNDRHAQGLYGDPAKEGMFALRIRMPKGYKIAPHTHPQPEVITVISGKFSLGMGPAADRASIESLPAGSFSSMPPGVAHYVFVDEDSVVQINATGPWGIDYIDPRNDPRLNVAPSK